MNNLSNEKKSSLVDPFIIFILFLSVLIFESIKTLSMLFTYGILRKEILTTKSNLGFDFKIKIR